MRPNTTVKFLYPIIPSGINPSIGTGPTQGQRNTLTRVGLSTDFPSRQFFRFDLFLLGRKIGSRFGLKSRNALRPPAATFLLSRKRNIVTSGADIRGRTLGREAALNKHR